MKKSCRELKKYAVVLLGILIFVISANLLRVSLAEENSDYSLSAVLYDTEEYSSGGAGNQLTESGITISNWDFNTSKYLQINPNVLADGNTYKVQVILPQEMYIVGEKITAPSGYSDVQFTKNPSISVNNGKGTYNLKNNSGTATYTLNYMGQSGTIQLELRYDTTLWDEQSGSSITPMGVKPIEVKLIKEEEETSSELKSVSVSKITAGSSMPGSNYYTYTNSDINTIGEVELLIGKRINANFYYAVNDIYSGEDCFFSELKIKIKLPEYTNDGHKYYLGIDKSTIRLNGMKTSYEYDYDTSEEGVVYIIVNNAYFGHGTMLLTYTFNDLPDELKAKDNSEFPMTFTSTRYTVYGNGKNGNNNIVLRDMGLSNIRYIKEAQPRVSTATFNRYYSITDIPHDDSELGGAVYGLGGAIILNEGTGDSGAKKFRYEFDTDDTGKIKVTTINVHADTVSNTINIKYTLVDDDGNRVFLDSSGNRVEEGENGAIGEWNYSMANAYYNSSALNNIFNRLTRKMLPTEQKNYYFKSIEYTLGKIRANAQLYGTGGNHSFSSAGNIFGYVSEDIEEDTSYYSRFYMINPETDETEGPVRTFSAITTKINNPSYRIGGVALNKSSIVAGESCVLSGNIYVIDYPYGYSGWLNAIRIGVLLPDGVTINSDSVNIRTASGQTVNNIDISNRSVGNGKILWTLKLPSEVAIGFARENLSALSSGSSLNFSMQLNTSYTMNATTIFSKEMLSAAGYKQSNSAGGSWNSAKKTDTYDLNEDGSTTDGIAGVSDSANLSCQIISQNAMLDVTETISTSNGGAISEDIRDVDVNAKDDEAIYSLNIDSESGGRISDFLYFVPIVNKESEKDNFLVYENEYTSVLVEKPTVIGNDLFKFEYSTENMTYTEAKENDVWYSDEDLENNSELNYKDVKIIRLTPKTDFIYNGDKTKINFKIKYGDSTFNQDAGKKIKWSSGGYYVHSIGERETAGNYSTAGVSATLKYNFENDDIVLTAAKDGTPSNPDNVNEVTVARSLFPEFVNRQQFAIKSVDNYNVILKSKAYMLENHDMAGSDANKTFAITVVLNDGTEVDILNSNEIIDIGTNMEDTAPEFKFKIYNANRLSDSSTSRYVIVNIESDKGATYKQKIVINRELTQASDPESAIVGGKNYIAFDETTETINISGDSAFTAQMVTSYIPSVYKNHKLQFSNNLPSGTTVTIANVTEDTVPKYYYYKADGNTSVIEFSNLINMGTTGTKGYVNYTDDDIVEERLLAIVDFSNSDSGYINSGTYTLKMIMESDTVEDYTSKELTFIVTGPRDFGITGEDSVGFNTDYILNYSIGSQNSLESKYEGRKASLIISMPNTIPQDAHLYINETDYYLNKDNQFIVPLGDVQETESFVSMKFISMMLPVTQETYNCNIGMWISGTANGEKPILGEKVAEKNITIYKDRELTPALKITGMSSRVLHKSDLSNSLTINYNYIKDSNLKLTIEMMQKVGNGYQKVTDKLSSVNGTTTHNMGAFDIPDNNGNNSVNARITSSIDAGTYRFMIRVSDSRGNEILRIPYNFIILED